MLIEALVLTLLESGKDFAVFSDVSLNGLGCVLMQEGKKELNLRQCHWTELLKDYDYVIDNHPTKANIVANALSRKETIELRTMFTQLSISNDGSFLAELKVKPVLFDHIRVAQFVDTKLARIRDMVQNGLLENFSIDNYDCLMFRNQIYVRDVEELKELILREAHKNRFSLYLGRTKMYHELRELYWWPRMKREIVEFVAKSLTCQQVKAEHQVPTSLHQPISIPEWK
ncbi:uncharacterized protein [Gossypium hirsutum]|uniref:Integrase zinc-binding domain-containing protein n=1 Tax=Gossypium hirsutum TaxID=3635 RepID=A0A1U8KP92_GOSHI|nr:uncharacterized protein LOC107919275 [Gossypium hirsutum]